MDPFGEYLLFFPRVLKPIQDTGGSPLGTGGVLTSRHVPCEEYAEVIWGVKPAVRPLDDKSLGVRRGKRGRGSVWIRPVLVSS